MRKLTIHSYHADLGVLLLLTALLLCTWLILPALPRSTTIPPDAPALALDGFYGLEQAPGQPPYRWSMRQSWIHVPIPGDTSILTLRLAGGPGRTLPLEMTLGTMAVSVPLAPDVRSFSILMPQATALRLPIRLSSDTFREPGGSRRLAFVFGGLHVAGSGFPPLVPAGLLGVVSIGCYVVLLFTRQRQAIAAGCAVLSFVVPLLWWQFGGWHSPLLDVAGWLLIVAAFSSLLLLLRRIAPALPQWERHIALILGAAVVGTGILLSGYAVAGWQVRLLADDYCQAAIAQRYGPFGAVGYWYTEWTGRFGSSLLLAISTLLGPWVAPLTPLFLLIVWSSGLALLCIQIARRLGHDHTRRVGMLLACLLIATTLAGLPNPIQSFFWQTGALTYATTLVGGVWYILVLMRSTTATRGRMIWLAAILLAALMLSGLSETGATTLAAANVLAFAIAMIWRTATPLRTALGIGMIGSLLGTALVALAPGNSVRNAALRPPPLEAGTLLSEAASFSALQLSWPVSPVALQLHGWLVGGSPTSDTRRLASMPPEFTFGPALLGTALLLVAVWIGFGSRISITRWKIALALGTATLCGGTLTLAAVLPSYLGLSNHPPDRALIIPQGIASLLIACWGWGIGVFLRTPQPALRHRIICLLIVLTLLPGAWFTGQRILAASHELGRYAAVWPTFDQAARAAAQRPERSLMVAAPSGFVGGLETLTPDPEYWLNRCIADYYGLERVANSGP